MSIFDGNRDAYGQFNFENKIRGDGKVKGSGITIRKKITSELWDAHLLGESQLGIVPINSDNMVRFGAIDIDDYSITDEVREVINAKIKRARLPLIQFRSKSGGIHLFCFTSDFASAAVMQKKLKEFAAFLGYGNSEIFPKQSTLLKDRGDIGQWINIPYFNLMKENRIGYDHDNNPLTPSDFISYYDLKKISPEKLEDFDLPVNEDLKDGPPCLQHLIQQGFPEGTRNNGLYNLGVYAQKAYGDKWPQKIEEYNNKYLKPPLAPREVLIIIASLRKKEYNYSCAKQPICAFCNSSLCRTRKFGIGQSAGLPVMGSLTKLDCEPPIWFIEVENGGRLELSTEELQNPVKFQKKCLDSLSTMPPIVTRQAWQIIISELLSNINIIAVPREHSPAGMLMDLLREFCLNRMHEDQEALIRGLVYIHEGYYYFRFKDFLLFLERRRFTEIGSNKIISILRDAGVKSKQWNLTKGINFNVHYVALWAAPEATTEPFTPPSQDKVIPF